MYEKMWNEDSSGFQNSTTLAVAAVLHIGKNTEYVYIP
jgi:hypothetical protein